MRPSILATPAVRCINLRGEVIGINTAIATTGMSQGNMGVGFAIPSNAIREILPQLRSGKVTRGRVGVQVGAVKTTGDRRAGLEGKNRRLVSAVEEKGPAEKAGVEIGDVILAWNGQPVRNSDELVQMVVRTKPGASIPVRIVRDKKERTLNITVEELDLETEGNSSRRVSSERTSAEPEPNKGFGMTLDNVCQLQRLPGLGQRRAACNCRTRCVARSSPTSIQAVPRTSWRLRARRHHLPRRQHARHVGGGSTA